MAFPGMPDGQAMMGAGPDPMMAAPPQGAPPPEMMPDDPYGKGKWEDIRTKVLKALDRFKVGRRVHEVNTLMNILFYRGQQWDTWDTRTNRFRPVNVPQGMPKPVTNVFAPAVGAYVAVVARVEPQLNFRPATDDPEDRATATVAGRAMPVIESETGIRLKRQELARWVGLSGGGWLEFGYDPDPIHGTTLLQHEQCMECGMTQAPNNMPCPQCGSGLLIPAQDEQGQPVGEQVPKGKMYAKVFSLLNMYFDPSITDWSEQREYITAESYHVDDAKRRWPAYADQIRADSLGESSDQIRNQLPTVGGYFDDRSAPRRAFGNATSPPLADRVTEMHYWAMPTDEYPDGLHVVMLGRTLVVDVAPRPYFEQLPDGQKRHYLNTVYFPADLVPGSAYGKTPADDLRYLQAERNLIQALIAMTIKRTAFPVWLKPAGANVTGLSGQGALPAQVIEYNAISQPAVKPERIPGQPVPAGVYEYVQMMIDAKVEEIMATYDIARGAKPSGVSAGVALQMLDEKSKSRFGSQFIMWEDAWAKAGKIQIEIFRQFATEERILKVQGRDGSWQVQKFLGADLTGSVDVVPEAGSAMPTSTLVQRAELEQMFAVQVVSPQDPRIRRKYLELVHHLDWLPDLEADTKNAMMEDEIFEQLAQQVAADPRMDQVLKMVLQQAQMKSQQAAAAGMPPVSFDEIVNLLGQYQIKVPRVRKAVDDHGAHSLQHKTTLKGEDSQRWPQSVQILEEMHTAEHDQMLAQQQQQQAMNQAGMHPTAGFLSNPGGMSAPAPSPHSAGASPQRMQGDMHEMQQSAT